jgi:hypothetical protein
MTGDMEDRTGDRYTTLEVRGRVRAGRNVLVTISIITVSDLDKIWLLDPDPDPGFLAFTQISVFFRVYSERDM